MNRDRFVGALLGLMFLSVLAVGCGAPPTPPAKGTPTAAKPAVTAKGAVVPARYANVAFSTSGTLAQLNVKKGDVVKAGAVLAQLDMQEAEFAVKAAQDKLALAQSTLAQAKAVASAQEITSAQADYDSAVAALNRAQQGPTAEEQTMLTAKLAKAKAALDQAQAAYDRAGGASVPYAGMLPTSLQLQTAWLDYQIAQADYDKANKNDPNSITQAQLAVVKAKAALDLKKNGPRAEDVAVAQAGIQQAQTGLEQAQAALAKTKLVAPFDGVIADLNLRPGEMVQPGTSTITVADLSQLRVETTDLDEYGTARVKVGQPVSIVVNAYEDKALSGKVQEIALRSVTLSTGDTSYVVTVALDKQDPDLRWGMTVKVDFGAAQ